MGTGLLELAIIGLAYGSLIESQAAIYGPYTGYIDNYRDQQLFMSVKKGVLKISKNKKAAAIARSGFKLW